MECPMIGDESETLARADRAEAVDEPKRTRERSKIEFPYADLESAAEIVRTLNSKSGTRCEINQLAIWLNQSPTGGTFRSRLSAAKLFELVETDRLFVTLTALGQSVLEPEKERGARVTAFLNAPLYRALYDQFEGHVLPPAAALERQIVGLGVPSKQKERARQTFVKSAQYAEFIDQQSGKIIKPATGGPPPSSSKPAISLGGGNGGGQSPRDPLLEGLFNEVPPRGTSWGAEDQVRWLETAAHVFALAFKRRERIKVELETVEGRS
jgi:hypothetical protein